MRVVALLYFMLPAYAANMAPPFVKYWKGWNPPIARRRLGEHKTVLGFASGVGAAVLVTFVQSRIAWEGSLVPYEAWPSLGLRFGIGAMAGDSAKSFLKRRAGIPPGERWIPFDQLDFAVGALVLTWSRAALSLSDIVILLIASAAGSALVTHLGYRAGVRATKW
ncbi:MAG: CDP-archaeol synthase [Candidatus Rokubacteria bacterium]|nr:CDP-archaeol synthase [Candidatus Rokubacteria bacterium]